jgi:molybdopterin converting factor small subunit/tRNA threonylcarbamoyladenosine modification (KEOPS) complex Cgi121 subunit
MITVKFLGGAKKSYSTDSLTIEANDLTLRDITDYLIKNKPKNDYPLDINNLLIAVNGVDSSAIQGQDTKLKNGDIVNIIPIIHGGSSNRIQFQISGTTAELFKIKTSKQIHVDFLDKLRNKFPNLAIQAIYSKYILSKSHAQKIIFISQMARKNNNLLSKKIETDILLRFAGTTQINEAIKRVGLKQKNSFILISIGSKTSLNRLFVEIKPLLSKDPFSNNNQNFLKKKFNISNKQIDSVLSNSTLEDILVEKAAILIG